MPEGWWIWKLRKRGIIYDYAEIILRFCSILSVNDDLKTYYNYIEDEIAQYSDR